MPADMTPERIAELRAKREVCWSGDHPEFVALLDAAERVRELEAALVESAIPLEALFASETNGTALCDSMKNAIRSAVTMIRSTLLSPEKPDAR